MTNVEIEYCVPCGHLDRANDLQHTLLSEFGQDVESVALVTGDGGVFEVRADGETVFDKADEGYDEAAIFERVRERL
jgi:selenoprotein W-related protein